MFADGDRADQWSRVGLSVVVGIYPTRPVLMQRSLDDPKKLIFCALTSRAFFNGLRVDARPGVMRALVAIVGARGKVVTHEDLLLLTWADDPEGGPDDLRSSLHTLMCSVRRAADALGLRIQNVWGHGWQVDLTPHTALQAAE